jgi:hypothetical protein
MRACLCQFRTQAGGRLESCSYVKACVESLYTSRFIVGYMGGRELVEREEFWVS